MLKLVLSRCNRPSKDLLVLGSLVGVDPFQVPRQRDKSALTKRLPYSSSETSPGSSSEALLAKSKSVLNMVKMKKERGKKKNLIKIISNKSEKKKK